MVGKTLGDMAAKRARHERMKAEFRRKQDMISYIADIEFAVRATSPLEARKVVSLALYPLVLLAGMQAGDVLEMVQKEQNIFSGTVEPTDQPGYYRFTGSVRFVSDSTSWEEASAWLQSVLDEFRHDDITVVGMEKYTGFWDG